MPKISPRPEVTGHPLYQTTMVAQHLAYQLMREVPADRKADAARVYGSCVHATTYASYALDDAAADRAGSYRNLVASVSEAKERLSSLVAAVAEAQDAELLEERLTDIGKAAEEGLRGLESSAA